MQKERHFQLFRIRADAVAAFDDPAILIVVSVAVISVALLSVSVVRPYAACVTPVRP